MIKAWWIETYEDGEKTCTGLFLNSKEISDYIVCAFKESSDLVDLEVLKEREVTAEEIISDYDFESTYKEEMLELYYAGKRIKDFPQWEAVIFVDKSTGAARGFLKEDLILFSYDQKESFLNEKITRAEDNGTRLFIER